MIMGKIDTSEWKKFLVGDLFEAYLSKDDIQPKNFVKGKIPLVSSGKENNGIIAFVEDEKARLWEENTLTIDMFGKVFYQESPYFAVSHGRVNILLPKISMTKGCLQFIGCAIEKVASQKYAFNEMCTGTKVLKNNIKLPSTPDGAPDWTYMESYMANLETKVAESLTMLQAAKDAEKKKVDTREWGEFRVGELFDIHPTKAYKSTNAELLDNGETHVVVNSAYNNGVGGLSTLKPTEQGNMITFSDTVDANTIFYQDKPFIGYPHVQGLYPIGIYCKKWTELSLKYFATVFRQKALSIGFDYGNKFRRDIAIKLYVLLPVDKTGQPDWAYMEEYMRKMERKTNDALNFLDRISTRRKIDDV